MDFRQFLDQQHADDAYGFGSKRVQISEEELKRRLDFYEEHLDGFIATDEHLGAMVDIFRDHRNVFLTGSAGTGKTTFVKSVIIPELDFRNLNWSVTASTGIAGSHLNGKTVNSFFGIGLGPNWRPIYIKELTQYFPCTPGYNTPCPQDMSDEELEGWYAFHFDEWMNSKRVKHQMREGVKNRLKSHEVLLIDEVSMLAGDKDMGFLDYMLRNLRSDMRPFGGLQMIFIGDFAQLPPVDKRRRESHRTDWAFLSRAWDKANVKPIELTKVFRQGDDEFIRFLNHIRLGYMTPEDKDFAARFHRVLEPEDTLNYTFLVPLNEQARDINARALRHYEGPTINLEAEFHIVPELQRMTRWESENSHKVRDTLIETTQKTRLVSHSTPMRVGMPVMITVNDPEGEYVNGTRGFVREIQFFDREQFDGEDKDYVVIGVPDTDSGEERLIVLHRWNYTRNRDQDPFDTIPVPDYYRDIDGAQLLPTEICSSPVMRQFPLIPAAAITIHKSQGMSLDGGILALARTFEAGHVYVGLSRLRSTENLVLSDKDFQVRADPYVLEYYKSIQEHANNPPPAIVPGD